MNELLHETRIQKLEIGHSVLVNEHTNLSESYKRIETAIVKISEILTDMVLLKQEDKNMSKLIEKQAQEISNISEKVHNIEVSLPQLIETRTWILVGLGIVISSVIIALIALVIK